MTDIPIRAILFDVFGTVVDWRGGIAREAEACLAPKGITIDWLAFAEAWRARYQPSMEPIRLGTRGYQRLDVLHYENMLDLLDEFAIDGLSGAELDQLNRAWHRLSPWPDCVSGLNRLKSRFIIGPLSNGNVSMMVNMAKHGGLPWDVVLGAEPARMYKPRRETYLTAADWLDLAPGQVLMCAAHNGDLAAAASCGMRTAFIPRPAEYGPGQTSDLAPRYAFDHIANDMNELADQLGC